eukprot:6214406-Pleurochrysis_carterae.AAC.2
MNVGAKTRHASHGSAARRRDNRGGPCQGHGLKIARRLCRPYLFKNCFIGLTRDHRAPIKLAGGSCTVECVPVFLPQHPQQAWHAAQSLILNALGCANLPGTKPNVRKPVRRCPEFVSERVFCVLKRESPRESLRVDAAEDVLPTHVRMPQRAPKSDSFRRSPRLRLAGDAERGWPL